MQRVAQMPQEAPRHPRLPEAHEGTEGDHRGNKLWKILAASGWLFALSGWCIALRPIGSWQRGAYSDLTVDSFSWTELAHAISEDRPSRSVAEDLSSIGVPTLQQREVVVEDTLASRRLRSTPAPSGSRQSWVLAERRLSPSPSPCSTVSTAASMQASSASSAEDHGHEAHDYETLVFLFCTILTATFLTWLTTFKTFRGLQQTVTLFVIGILCSLLQEGLELHDHLGIFGRSYKMWMDIDPHLLLYTMLPALLTADAMNIDTSVAMRVAHQCIYLAGPGVLINAMCTALFLWYYLPYNWSFLLCLTSGAILCATDPVAVVALLKELGASPTLTVQIQGESLLNDGTAIVLYLLAYNMLKGDAYDTSDIIIFLVKVAMCAWALGMIIGCIFLSWIRACSNKLDHSSGLVQTVLTLSCAYWSFIIAEGFFSISGVLSCVASSLVLAHKMWPSIVDKPSLQAFWHTFEYLGNTLIFFLAGALTGNTMVHIEGIDYFHLIVIYCVLILTRGGLLFLSRPILKYLSADNKEITIADTMVMTWGGLRGAVGLALAIQVANEKANGEIGDADARRVLFYVGGVAALTLVVNATTCPFLVQVLGITNWPEAKNRMLLLFHAQLRYRASAKPHTVEVTTTINGVLDDVEHHISVHAQKRQSVHKVSVVQFSRVGSEFLGRPSMRLKETVAQKLQVVSYHQRGNFMQGGASIIEDLKHAKAGVTAITWLNSANDSFTAVLKKFPKVPFREQEEQMFDIVAGDTSDPPLMRQFNECMMMLVRAQYWKQIERGELPTVKDSELLLLSITLSLSQPQYDLIDFHMVCQQLDKGTKKVAPSLEDGDGPPSTLHRFVESLAFTFFMTVMIVGSAIVTQLEDRSEYSFKYPKVFLALEITFITIFTFEFVLKFADMKVKFWRSKMNIFDFILVLLGLFGLALGLAVQGSDDTSSDVSAQGRLIRIARVFRVLRLVRIIRLYRFYMTLKSKLKHLELSLELADHLHRIAVLTSFVKAHVNAQHELVRCFCRDGKITLPEIARCLLQSQTFVYKSIAKAVQAEQSLDKSAMRGVIALRETIDVIQDLEHFVLDAHHSGIIESRETESILHPMHSHMKAFCKQISNAYEGLTHGVQEKEITKSWSQVLGVRSEKGNKSAESLDDIARVAQESFQTPAERAKAQEKEMPKNQHFEPSLCTDAELGKAKETAGKMVAFGKKASTKRNLEKQNSAASSGIASSDANLYDEGVAIDDDESDSVVLNRPDSAEDTVKPVIVGVTRDTLPYREAIDVDDSVPGSLPAAIDIGTSSASGMAQASSLSRLDNSVDGGMFLE